jgi:hypothetical protein
VARRILKEYPSASRLSAVNENSTLKEMVDAVKRWLDNSKNTRWPIMYGNYDDPKVRDNTDLTVLDLRQFLPETDHRSIIVTTRLSQVKLGHRLRVGKLENIRDSLEILSNMSGRERVINGKLYSQLKMLLRMSC